MITFKQFLNEEDETDTRHASIEAAAQEYVKHCSGFRDIDHPLYRISGESWMRNVKHPLRTRVPRTRNSPSVGGTADEQAFIFSQPSWAEYPKRRQSIFCSTTKDFEIGDPADDGSNLLMIFPFDGVKIAVLDDTDLNTMNVIRGTSVKSWIGLSDLFDLINAEYNTTFSATDSYDHQRPVLDKLREIKKYFNHSGSFDPEANGNDELADNYAEIEHGNAKDGKVFRMVATEIPEKLSPEGWNAKLVTSSELQLPGATRECWFSGKYLSVPSRYYEQFKAEVKKLQDSK